MKQLPKIYFAGSIRGGRKDVKLYHKIIGFLNRNGKVLTEHVGDDSLLEKGEEKLSDRDIHDRDLQWILESDFLVAEVSSPSLGVGYEIRYAIENRKRIICLYHIEDGKSLSAMISGAEGIEIIEYRNEEDLFVKLNKAL